MSVAGVRAATSGVTLPVQTNFHGTTVHPPLAWITWEIPVQIFAGL